MRERDAGKKKNRKPKDEGSGKKLENVNTAVSLSSQ
jgi:hypothetical protein